MKNWLCFLLFSFSPYLAGAGTPKIVGYVPIWIDVPRFAETIDYGLLTHINLAFENPTNDLGGLSFHAKTQSLISRAHKAGVKILVSIGGGAASENKTLQNRYFGLLSNSNRNAFAKGLLDYVVAHDLDGLDIDLEGPSINKDYGDFVTELARLFQTKGKLLTAALSKGHGGAKVPDSVFAHFDFVNIMAYDGKGPWNTNAPGQHSSLEFAIENVNYWIKRGLPKSKAVLGVPFYGYGFGKAYRNRDYPYSYLISQFEEAAQNDEVGETIWHNGIPTVRSKVEFVLQEELAGVMIWSLDYDVKGKDSLLRIIHQSLIKANP